MGNFSGMKEGGLEGWKCNSWRKFRALKPLENLLCSPLHDDNIWDLFFFSPPDPKTKPET
jgi:hypothetical protein